MYIWPVYSSEQKLEALPRVYEFWILLTTIIRHYCHYQALTLQWHLAKKNAITGYLRYFYKEGYYRLNQKNTYGFMIIIISYNSTFRTYILFNLKDLRFCFLTLSKSNLECWGKLRIHASGSRFEIWHYGLLTVWTRIEQVLSFITWDEMNLFYSSYLSESLWCLKKDNMLSFVNYKGLLELKILFINGTSVRKQ